MFKRIALPIFMLFILALSACGPAAPTLPPIPTTTAGIPTQAAPTATLPPATNAPAPSETPTTPVALPTATVAQPTPNIPVTSPTSANYIDDRSTPSQVIVSYYNAVNRREYSRAYDYYTTPSTTLGNFTTFANGYATTTSVDLVFGQITSDSGAGQTFFTVPVILKAVTSNNVHTNYAACYIVHQANPANFGGPNFNPMSIDKGQAKTMAAGAVDSAALATACTGMPTGPNLVNTGAESMDISKNNFIDNRSGPIETVSSLFNSINLKQFSRAYSYFETPQTFPGDFNTYAAGYANTAAITATFGTVQSEGAAGSTFYKVPVGMVATTTSNTTQTFVGCFTLHLAQPANQTVPPFHPLSIVSGNFKQENNNVDINSLLPTACQ